MTEAEVAGWYAIRRLVSADLAQADAVLRESPEAAQWSLRDSFANLAQTVQALVAVERGDVIGLIVLQTAGGDAEILNLAVRGDRRRRGVARALLASATGELRSIQTERIFLEVRESNAAARGLYEAHGFADAGRRRSYYENPREDALVLSLFLKAG